MCQPESFNPDDAERRLQGISRTLFLNENMTLLLYDNEIWSLLDTYDCSYKLLNDVYILDFRNVRKIDMG